MLKKINIKIPESDYEEFIDLLEFCCDEAIPCINAKIASRMLKLIEDCEDD